LNYTADEVYVAEMYALDEHNTLRMTDMTSFLAGDAMLAKIRCEAWASHSTVRKKATHVRLRRADKVVYLRAIASAEPSPHCQSKAHREGRRDLAGARKPEAPFNLHLRALRALSG
jgi:hypothetical protein